MFMGCARQSCQGCERRHQEASEESARDAAAARSAAKQDERHRRITLRSIFRTIDVFIDGAVTGATRVADNLVEIDPIPNCFVASGFRAPVPKGAGRTGGEPEMLHICLKCLM
jgi:hypothetical protein